LSRFIDVGDKWYYVLHPRPVYILVAEREGSVNFMAASWVMPFSEEPPRVVVALDKEALTTEYIRSSMCFTVNVLGLEYRDFVYRAGTVSGREVDKLSFLGASVVRDTATGAPRLQQPRPIGYLDVRVYRVVGDLAEDVDLVVGDVVSAYADEGLFSRYGWDLRKVKILLHSAGRAFTTQAGIFIAKK